MYRSPATDEIFDHASSAFWPYQIGRYPSCPLSDRQVPVVLSGLLEKLSLVHIGSYRALRSCGKTQKTKTLAIEGDWIICLWVSLHYSNDSKGPV